MGKRGEELQAGVMAILRAGRGPMSAYDVLELLKATYPKIAPPTVYRGLAALMEKGRVQRLESLNAYMARQDHENPDPAILSICNDCGTVEENADPDVFQHLSSALKKAGFSAQRHVLEVHGVCSSCETEA